MVMQSDAEDVACVSIRIGSGVSREVLESVERDVLDSGGSASLLPINDPKGERFTSRRSRRRLHQVALGG